MTCSWVPPWMRFVTWNIFKCWWINKLSPETKKEIKPNETLIKYVKKTKMFQPPTRPNVILNGNQTYGRSGIFGSGINSCTGSISGRPISFTFATDLPCGMVRCFCSFHFIFACHPICWRNRTLVRRIFSLSIQYLCDAKSACIFGVVCFSLFNRSLTQFNIIYYDWEVMLSSMNCSVSVIGIWHILNVYRCLKLNISLQRSYFFIQPDMETK